jgi:hypothetical protein
MLASYIQTHYVLYTDQQLLNVCIQPIEVLRWTIDTSNIQHPVFHIDEDDTRYIYYKNKFWLYYYWCIKRPSFYYKRQDLLTTNPEYFI